MSLSDHKGTYETCELCGHQGCTADDISWNALLVGWVCDACKEGGIPEDVKHLVSAPSKP